jgi:surface antigen
MRTGRVKRWAVLLGGLLLAAGSGGCSTMNNTEKGVGLGAAAGTGVGLGVGALTGNPKTGAVVGGLLGAGVGGAVGNDMDRQDQQKREIRQATAIANAQAQPKMGMMDVVQMVQNGHDEQVIINQIRSTGSSFQLSQADLDYLKAYNVPPRVIVEMQNARPSPILVRQPRPVVVREDPVVIYERPAPVYVGPPVFVGGYYRRW